MGRRAAGTPTRPLLHAGKKVKVSMKLAATNCTTPAALPLNGKFAYVDATGAKTVEACLKKPVRARASYAYLHACCTDLHLTFLSNQQHLLPTVVTRNGCTSAKGCADIPKAIKTPKTLGGHGNNPINACTCSACDVRKEACRASFVLLCPFLVRSSRHLPHTCPVAAMPHSPSDPKPHKPQCDMKGCYCPRVGCNCTAV